LIPMLALV